MNGIGRRRSLGWLGAAALAALGLPTPPAAAQSGRIWRCGPDGRQFSDRPCSGGLDLPGPEPVSAEAQQAAQTVARREQALAERLALERHQRNQVAPGSGLMGIGGEDTRLRTAHASERGRRKPVKPPQRPGREHRGPPAQALSRQGLQPEPRRANPKPPRRPAPAAAGT